MCTCAAPLAYACACLPVCLPACVPALAQRMLFLCGLPEDGYCLGAMGYVELAGELGSNHVLALEALHNVMVRRGRRCKCVHVWLCGCGCVVV